MTQEQSDFLEKFADEKLAEIAAEEARVEEAEAKRIKDTEYFAELASIKARKEAELAQELLELEETFKNK